MTPSDSLEIPPSRLAEMPDALVLDVREPFEWEICHLPNSLLIPLGQLPNRLQELPRDQTVVVLCHHGMRSLQATRFLRASGFADVFNLTGGIDRWARERDPEMNRY